MYGTIRTFETGVREMVVERFEQIIQGIAGSMGCQADVNIRQLTPAVINSGDVAGRVAAATKSILPESEVDSQYRTMISDDMAFFLNRVPGCFILLGSANAERGLNYAHHHPKFDFDELALPKAAALIAASTMELLA
jgi:amidohydrolase